MATSIDSKTGQVVSGLTVPTGGGPQGAKAPAISPVDTQGSIASSLAAAGTPSAGFSNALSFGGLKIQPNPVAVTAAPAIANTNKIMGSVNALASSANVPKIQPAGTKLATAPAAAATTTPKTQPTLTTVYNAQGHPMQIDKNNLGIWTSAGWAEKPPAPAGASTIPTTQPDQTGATGTAPAPTQTTTEQSSVDRMQAANDTFTASMKAATDKAEADLNDYNSKLLQIQNGTYPLSATQQQQIDDIQAQFNGMIQAQMAANKNYEGAVARAGISAGRNMYAPEIELGNVKKATDEGIAKINGLNMQMSQAITMARDAFANQNFKMLQQVYANIDNLNKSKQASISELYSKTKDLIAAAQQDHTQKLEDQKFEFTKQQELAKPAIEAAANVQQFIMQQIAKYPDAGVTPADSVAQAMDKIKNSNTFKNAAALSGLDVQAKQAQISLTKSEIAKNYEALAKARTEREQVAAMGGGTAPTANAAVQAILEGRDALSNYPKRSTGGGPSWQAVHDAVLAAKPDFNFAQGEAAYKSFIQSSEAQAKTYTNLKNLENSAKATLDNIKVMNAELKLSDVPAVAHGQLTWGSQVSGDTKIRSYLSAIEEARAQASTILGGGSVTDMSRKQAEEMIPANASPAQMDSLIETVKTMMSNKINSFAQPTTIQQNMLGAGTVQQKTPGAGKFSLVIPGANGTLYFNDQASYNKAKQDAGL